MDSPKQEFAMNVQWNRLNQSTSLELERTLNVHLSSDPSNLFQQLATLLCNLLGTNMSCQELDLELLALESMRTSSEFTAIFNRIYRAHPKFAAELDKLLSYFKKESNVTSTKPVETVYGPFFEDSSQKPITDPRGLINNKLCKLAALCSLAGLTGVLISTALININNRESQNVTRILASLPADFYNDVAPPKEPIAEMVWPLDSDTVTINRPKDIPANLGKICNRRARIHLVFDPIDPFEWKNITLDCGDRVRSVTLKGYMSPQTIHDVLSKLRNLHRIEIFGDHLCLTSSGLIVTLPKFNPVALNRTQFLSIKNIKAEYTNCREIFAFLALKVQLPILKCLHLENVALDMENQLEFQHILRNARKTLEEVHLDKISFLNNPFDFNFPSLTLNKFEVNLHHPKNSDPVAANFLKRFLIQASSIREYSSNVKFSEENFDFLLSRLSNLRVQAMQFVLPVRVRPDSTGYADFSFLSKMSYLQRCNVELINSQPWSKSVELGWNDMAKASKLVRVRVTASFPTHLAKGNSPGCFAYFKTKDANGQHVIILTRTSDQCRRG